MGPFHSNRSFLMVLVALLTRRDVLFAYYTPSVTHPRGRGSSTLGLQSTTFRPHLSKTFLKVDQKVSEDVEKKQEEEKDLSDSLREAALQVGSDLWSTLRWGAANALTSSLPDEQRKDLLDRLDDNPEKTNDNDDDEDYQENSVGETIAAAVAAESQKEKARWEREKEEILAKAQKAAEERVGSELAIQQQRLEQEKQEMANEAKEQLEKLLREKKEQEEKAIQEKREQEEWFKKELEEQERELKRELELQEKSMAWKKEDSDSGDNDHPILGPAITDLGYKRVHLVSATALATIPIWKKQRVYRHDRAKTMAADKIKTKHLGLPGVICLHEETNGKLSIVDGQHRVGMMKILQDKQNEAQQNMPNANITMDIIDLDRILVEVYPQRTEIRTDDYAQDIFLEINKAEPVKLVDMPGVASAKDRKLISTAINRLEAAYPTMFSPSQRCRVPHVNIDNLRDNVFAANVIKRKDVNNANKLHDWLISENKLLGKKFAENEELQRSVNQKAWAKAQKYEFYLGLESSWLYN